MKDSKYYLQLNFVALKRRIQESLLARRISKNQKNKNFIKAWINSNKVEINFKE
jgi:hypothetical protein